MAIVYIGLGSNIGDRSANIEKACKELLQIDNIELIKKSSVEETDPVDFLEQPKFFNQIIVINTIINPEELLGILKKIEENLGRRKTIPKGPRIIDMDILLYDKLIFDSPALTIPHPQIKKRNFILKHLMELEPDLLDPITGFPYINFYHTLIENP